jgi:hypothetical protein
MPQAHDGADPWQMVPPPARARRRAGARGQARIVGLALVGAVTNVGVAWSLTAYQDGEARMAASRRRMLRGALT